jgi:hypothetical protein
MIKSIIKIVPNNSIIDKFISNPMNQLIDKLNKLIDVFNINLYTNLTDNNLMLNQMHYNQIVFFLLKIKSDNSTKLLNELFDNNQFNLYADLNYIIIKHIIINDDKQRLNRFNKIIEDFPHIFTIIRDQLVHITDKKIIRLIFYKEVTDIFNLDYTYIDNLLCNNRYFLALFTRYFIKNYDFIFKSFSADQKRFHKLLNIIIYNQTDDGLIKELFEKIKNIDHLNVNISKYQLFNKLYININIKKLIDKLK